MHSGWEEEEFEGEVLSSKYPVDRWSEEWKSGLYPSVLYKEKLDAD
jgi:hypothetical protein